MSQTDENSNFRTVFDFDSGGYIGSLTCNLYSMCPDFIHPDFIFGMGTFLGVVFHNKIVSMIVLSPDWSYQSVVCSVSRNLFEPETSTK